MIEDPFSGLFHANPVGMGIIATDGTILDVNRSLAAILGYEKAELIGRTSAELGLWGTPENRARVTEEFQKSGSLSHAEVEIRTKIGQTRYADIALEHIAYQGRPAILSVLHDITEGKKLENDILRNKRSTELLYEVVGKLLISREPQEIVEELCLKVMEFLGCHVFFNYLVDDEKGRLRLNAYSGIPPGTAEEIRWLDYGVAVCGCVAREGCRIVAEEIQTKSDPRTELVKSFGVKAYACHPLMRGDQVIGTLSFGTRTQDAFGADELALMKAVADHVAIAMNRIRAEANLKRSEERLKILIDKVASGIALVDERGRFSNYNSAFLKMFGLEEEEILNLNDLNWSQWQVYEEDGSLLHVDDHPVRKAMLTAKPVKDRTVGVQWPSGGELVWMSISAEPLLTPQGAVDMMICTYQDITERKKAEEDLRKADQQKDDFLAVLSHELRNPLASISNSLYIMDRVDSSSERAFRAREIMKRQTGQLVHLVDDLLDLTRITQNKIRLKLDRVELNHLVRCSVEDHRPLFEQNGIELRFGPGPSPVFLKADKTRIAQVVGNLLFNAMKFTDRGGHVRVSVETDSFQQAVIRVADSGVGLAPEIIGSLFEPFQQADHTLDRSRGGLGLGLALVKGFVELHGGKVSVSSAGPGKGSEFIVRIPLEKAGQDEKRPVKSGSPWTRRRILIIDDIPDVAESLQEILKVLQHEVEVASGGLEGIRKAYEFRPDVLLCDIGLPGMDGYEVARAFRRDRALQRIYLIALTGYGLPEDIQKALDAGFDRHLVKPLDLGQLQETLAWVQVES